MNTLADCRFRHMLGLSVLLHGALLLALPRLPVTPTTGMRESSSFSNRCATIASPTGRG